VDDRIEPLRPTTVTSQNAVIELFAEDAAAAEDGVAPKAACHDCQSHSAATKWQVGGPSQMSALDASA
jgi:hypothetical protein